MNHKKIFANITVVILAVILTACSSAAPTTIPTPEPLSCPTTEPLSCPTQASTEPQTPVLNAWRWGYTNDVTNVIITFDPGDKCSMEFIKPLDGNGLAYEIVVNDNTYQNYVVAVLDLEEGKTLNDLKDYHASDPNATNPPEFANLELLEIVAPMSRTFHGVRVDKSPVYFTCIVQGPGEQKILDAFGGVQFTEQ